MTQEPHRDALATRRAVLAGAGIAGLAGMASGCASAASGSSVVGGPAPSPLPAEAIKVDGDSIVLG